jgi:hypothetical protein
VKELRVFQRHRKQRSRRFERALAIGRERAGLGLDAKYAHRRAADDQGEANRVARGGGAGNAAEQAFCDINTDGLEMVKGGVNS